MKKNIFLAKSINGKLDFGSDLNESRLKQCVKDNPNKTFRVEMVESKRSLPQNSYYWLYLGVIARETGDDENSLHEYFRRTLLPPKMITVMKKEIRVPTSTTELSKVDFGEYLDRICSLTSVPLPDRELAGFYCDK